jgi:hypothetical protein
MRDSTRYTRNSRQRLLACCIALAVATLAYGQVNLSLEPADTSVSPGATVELQLWARSTSPLPLDGAEVVLRWDPVQLTLAGYSPGTSAYTWGASGFPSASPTNTTWDDGDALYQCLTRLGAAPPQTDIMLAVLQFTASGDPAVAVVSIPDEGDTLVASAGLDVLAATAGATVRIGSPGDGSGGGNPDTGGGTGGDGDTGGGSGDSGNGDTPGGQDGDTGGGDSGSNPPTDGSSQGDDNNETPPVRPVFALPCGAGAVQGVVLSALVMTVGQQRKRRWAT